MCIRALFIHIHPKVLCKPPMFSKHPHSPERKCSHAEMCPAIPRSLRGAGSDAWQMSLEGISAGAVPALWSVGLPFQSHQLHQLPASLAGFESVGLQLGLYLTWWCPLPFIFNALLLILYLCSCGVHSGCWCVVLLESSSEQLAGPEPEGDGFPPVKPAFVHNKPTWLDFGFRAQKAVYASFCTASKGRC